MTKDADKHTPLTAIMGGLSLGGDPKRIQAYYQNWSTHYDTDVAAADYAATHQVIDCLLNAPADPRLAIAVQDRELQLHDAGCGTGLLAVELHKLGYHHIDGSDLTPEMVRRARARRVYRELTENVDLNAPPSPDWRRKYDAVLCCGVFTSGHIQPQALLNLFAMTRIGGLVIVSTRAAYYVDSDYQASNDAFIRDRRAKLLANRRDAPYIADSLAHYWTYLVLN